MSSKVRLFADDCLIYRNIKNKEGQIALQKDLNLLENWGNTWGMRFNAAKCNIMRVSRTRDPKLFNYSLTGQVLEEVMDAKYLGVTLSNDLEWSKHIATMTNKANSKLWLQTTQPTSGGAVTVVSSFCANCVEPPRPQQWLPDLPFFGHAGHAAPLDGWMAGAAAHKSG